MAFQQNLYRTFKSIFKKKTLASKSYFISVLSFLLFLINQPFFSTILSKPKTHTLEGWDYAATKILQFWVYFLVLYVFYRIFKTAGKTNIK